MASRRHQRERQCGDKQQFVSVQDAKIQVWKLRNQQGYTGTMNAYKCRFCHRYHIGHALKYLKGLPQR